MSDVAERIKQLEMELKKEKEKNAKAITIKVSEKGAVQINGIRRFPIVLYKNEMEKILDMKVEIEDFIKSNISNLKTL